ncbi:cytochrome P450 2U1-like, partial [Stegodyphus dumicola]|uniref:cytochrome P450 2U1-like n=1 Tax=Stegodyphus dumicola TaxID=202533 RepID=UPI0015B12D7A
ILPDETNINGYRIPRRSILIVNLYTINNDPDIFPDPKRFDPKRFLGENNKKLKLVGPYPFGIGKRSCIGESLAQMEVFLIIASLLQNFTLLPGDGNGTLRAIPRN